MRWAERYAVMALPASLSERCRLPLKRKRYTRLSAMTLCIAVVCREHVDTGLEPRVVCCFDRQVGNDYEKSETEYKFRMVGHQTALMYSGPLIPAKDLLSNYAEVFEPDDVELTRDNYRDLLWQPMRKFVEENEARSGYQDSVDVSLLSVNWIGNSFRILTIDSHGIHDHAYFGAIGSGADSATSMLRWRRPSNQTDLHAALYFAYEAKTLGEVSPHVGEHTHLNIISRQVQTGGISSKIIGSQGVKELEDLFKRCGPQEFEWGWKMSDKGMQFRG
jgi:hypothetical protein